MCKAIEKRSLNYNYSFCIKRLAMCIIVISLIYDKISKPVSKETFIEASNVYKNISRNKFKETFKNVGGKNLNLLESSN